MIKKKKSQIMIFVVIGIILVVVTIFLFTSNDVKLFQSHDTKLKNQISTIVKDCISKSGNNGVYILGAQGGVINISKQVELNPTRYADFGLKIPNWDTQRGQYPTISSMEYELSSFIEENSIGCIKADLRTLYEVFDIEFDEEENFNVETRINKENVVIESSYAITFNEKNSLEILTISDYTVELENLRLGELYSLAVQIYNSELETHFLEELIIDQISSASDYSSKESMPTEGMSISCGQRVWTIPQLKENLANLNNNNFKYLQIDGTYSKESIKQLNLNEEDGTEKYRAYFDKIYRVKLDEVKPSYKNFNVEVFMPSTEITNKDGYFKKYPYREFEVTPSSGQIVKSMNLEIGESSKIPVPCIQIYHHLYNLDYDLIFKLTDYNDDGNGYSFQFPLRVQIENNVPKEKPISNLEIESTTTFTKESYCNSELYKYPLLVLTFDNQENPLNNVDISYKCINVKCDMGQTEKPLFMGMERTKAIPQLETKYPFCVGGSVIAEKEGYHTAKKRVTTDDGLLRAQDFVRNNNLVEFKLIPKKTFEVNMATFLIMPREVSTSDRVAEENDGVVFISIENQGLAFGSEAIWPNEKGFLDTIELLDDDGVNYNLSVVYLDGDNELKGMLEIKNWTPNIHTGNKITFKIPSTLYPILEDSYLDFSNYVETQSSKPNFQPIIY